MEKTPGAVFYAKELTAVFPQEFDEVRRQGLLRRVQIPLDGSSYRLGLARPYTVVELEDGSL